MKGFDPRSIKLNTPGKLVLVYADLTSVVRETTSAFPREIAVLADQDGKILWQLKARWLPRYFVLDGLGAVVDHQVDQNDGGRFVLEAVRP